MFKVVALFFLSITLYATPSWLYNLKSNKNHVIGYGVHDDLSKAKQIAISEIANSLYVSVESDVDIATKTNNNSVDESASIELKTHSQAKLSGVEFIKVQELDNKWYVAAQYDNSALEIKLAKLLPKNLTNEIQNKYLKNTPLIQTLNKSLGKELNYKIVRKNNLWQLEYKDILLPIHQEDFYKLFSVQNTKELSILPNQKIYLPYDQMFFKINHKEKGYISILYVEHNGKVGVLMANKSSEKSFLFPEKTNKNSFTVANPYKKTIKELYIVLHSKEELNLHKFENVGASYLDESNYNFDKLTVLLNETEFATFEIKIRK